MNKIALRERVEDMGGEGSGNFGHAGRPGEVGGSGEGGGSIGTEGLMREGNNIVGFHNTSNKNATKIKQGGFVKGDSVFGNAVYLGITKDTITKGNSEAQLKVTISGDIKLNNEYNNKDAYERLSSLKKSIYSQNLSHHFTKLGFDGLNLSKFTFEPQIVIYNTSKIKTVK